VVYKQVVKFVRAKFYAMGILNIFPCSTRIKGHRFKQRAQLDSVH